MPSRGLRAFGAVCSVMVVLGVTAVTHADRSARQSASPLSAGPVTGLPGAAVAVAQGEPTSAGEATAWVLGGPGGLEGHDRSRRHGHGDRHDTAAAGRGRGGARVWEPPPGPGLRGLQRRVLSRVRRLRAACSCSIAPRRQCSCSSPGRTAAWPRTASLPVGSRPSAFVRANFNEDEDQLIDIAVSNEGSDDVSILLAREDGTLRRNGGSRSARGRATSSPGSSTTAAATTSPSPTPGAATVSFLRGDGEGRFDPGEVDIGGPADRAPPRLPDGWSISTTTDRSDLLVADATTARSRAPRAPRRAAAAARVARFPARRRRERAGRARVTEGLGDERPHALVAARGTGEVFDIPISDTGALGAPVSVLSGARPAAIDVRDALTADLAADVVVADDSGALRYAHALPEPDRRPAGRAPRTSPPATASSCGPSAWESKRYRLRIADRSGVRDLPASSSRHPLAPRLGRAADGTPVVTYRRCRARGCTPWVWSCTEDRARPLHVPTPADAARRTSRRGVECSRSSAPPATTGQLPGRRPRAVDRHTHSSLPDQRSRDPARRPARPAGELVRRRRDLRAPAREPVARTAAHGHDVDGR